MKKEILHIQKISDTDFAIHVGNNVFMSELEFGIAEVMYKIILKYMKSEGLEDNPVNFNKICNQYGDAVKVNTGVIYDSLHPDERDDNNG